MARETSQDLAGGGSSPQNAFVSATLARVPAVLW
jgi:hypothetical protein